VRASLLAELSDLFLREASRALKRSDFDESERLWDISDELHQRKVDTERAEAGRPVQ
jgi:hypothetical protein